MIDLELLGKEQIFIRQKLKVLEKLAHLLLFELYYN